MKKIISMVTVLTMLMSMLCGIGIVKAEETPIGGNCLLFEDFESYTADAALSAKDNVSLGNAVGAVVQNDATLGNYLERTYVVPTEGTADSNLKYTFEGASKIIVDFSIRNIDSSSSAFIAAYDSSKSVNAGPSFEVKDGTVKGWKDGGFNQNIVSDSTRWIAMRFIADTATQTAEVWYNGRSAGSFAFRAESGNLLDTLRIDVRGGTYHFDNIRVCKYNDYYVKESFNEYTTGQLPAAGIAKDDLANADIVTGVFSVSDKALVLNNTTTAEHRMWYTFPENEEIAVEFDIKGASAGGNIYINRYDKNDSTKSHLNSGVAMTMSKGVLKVYNVNTSNVPTLATLTDTAYTHVKVIANAKTQKEQIWINGILKGEYGFRAQEVNPTMLDKISFRVSAGSSYTIDNLRISKPGDYYVYENFEDYTVGEVPVADTVISAASVKNDTALSASTGNNGKYMVLNGVTAEEKMIYGFPAAEKVAMEFKVYNPYSDTTANKITIYLHENNKATTGAPIIVEQGRIIRYDDSANAVWMATPSKQKWDKIKVVADAGAQTFKLWVNGASCGEFDLRNTPASFGQMTITAYSDINRYVDDLKIYPVVDSAISDVSYADGKFVIDAELTVETNIVTSNIYDVLTITDEYGRDMAYSYVNDVSDSKLYIKPKTDLLAGVTYTLKTTGLTDSNGTAFGDVEQSFTMDGEKSDVDIAGISLVNQDGSKYIKTGNTAKISATVLNAGDMDSYKLILAYYNSDGVLVNSEISNEKTAELGKETSSEFAGAQVIDDEISTVKAFIWSDTTTMIPYATADVSHSDDVSFNDSETLTVAMLGDSITAGCDYEKWIEHYYNVKYPERDIVFINKGISRNNAEKIVRRFDWDILNNEYTDKPDVATLMIGMNDINRDIYPDGTDEDKEYYLNWCYGNIENIIKLCQANDIELTLITPSLYDELDTAASGTITTGANEALGKVAAKMKEFAQTYKLEVIDMYTATNEINTSIRNNYSLTGNLLTNDRIHLNELGSVAFAYSFIKAQLGNDAETSVEIAADGTVTAKNAVVSGFEKTANGASFIYTPKGLPMAVTDEYITLEGYGVEITETINREIIKIAGLEDGEYTLSFGDEIIGTYTAAKLAEGINIAANEANPGQIKAKELFANTKQKRFYEHRTRCSAYSDELMRSEGIEYTDDDVAYEWLNEKVNDSAYASHKDFLSITIRDVWGKKASVWENLNSYEKAAETAPYAYNYTVSVTKN